MFKLSIKYPLNRYSRILYSIHKMNTLPNDIDELFSHIKLKQQRTFYEDVRNLDSSPITRQLYRDGKLTEITFMFRILKIYGYDNYFDVLHLMPKHIDDISLNIKDIHGWTILHWAIFRKQPDLIAELIKRNININDPDLYDITPNHLALFINDSKILTIINSPVDHLPLDFHDNIIEKLQNMENRTTGVFYTCFHGLLRNFAKNVNRE